MNRGNIYCPSIKDRMGDVFIASSGSQSPRQGTISSNEKLFPWRYEAADLTAKFRRAKTFVLYQEQPLTQYGAKVFMAPNNDTNPGLDSMSTEEFVNWLLSEPDPIPLASFPLQTNEGRREFLREYVRRGEQALFEAVGHIWAQLNEPREARCTAMGMAAGAGGKGKKALVNLLSAVLEEVVSINAILPKSADFPSLDEWHRAVVQSFEDEELATNAVFQRFSDFLNGGAEMPAPTSAELIVGPWSDSPMPFSERPNA